MQSEELAALRTLQAVKPCLVQKADLAGIVAWADEHIFERRAVVHDHELMAAALERGRGEDFDLGALRQAIDKRGYLREKDSDKLTSREVLTWELEVVVAAHDGRNRHAAMSPDYRASPSLSAEQAVAVDRILRSRDFITLFRGGAGTGKSFALKEVEQGLTAAGRPVVVLVPQRQQVQDLQAEGLAADTLVCVASSTPLTGGRSYESNDDGASRISRACESYGAGRHCDGSNGRRSSLVVRAGSRRSTSRRYSCGLCP